MISSLQHPSLDLPLALANLAWETRSYKSYTVSFEAPERHRELKLARIALWKSGFLTLWPPLLAKALQGLHPGTVTFIAAWKVHESDTWLQKIASHWARDILPLRPSVPDHCHLELLQVPGVFWTQNIISVRSSRHFWDERRAEPLHLSPQPGCILRYLAKERSLTLWHWWKQGIHFWDVKVANTVALWFIPRVKQCNKQVADWSAWFFSGLNLLSERSRLPHTVWHSDESKLTYKQAHALRVWLRQGEN